MLYTVIKLRKNANSAFIFFCYEFLDSWYVWECFTKTAKMILFSQNGLTFFFFSRIPMFLKFVFIVFNTPPSTANIKNLCDVIYFESVHYESCNHYNATKSGELIRFADSTCSLLRMRNRAFMITILPLIQSYGWCYFIWKKLIFNYSACIW